MSEKYSGGVREDCKDINYTARSDDLKDDDVLYDAGAMTDGVDGQSSSKLSMDYDEDGASGGKGEVPSPSEARMVGNRLDLSLAEPKKGIGVEVHEGIQEELIDVIFDLPDGSQGEALFKWGHTIEYMKSYIESEFGIPMREQKLYLEERLLIDPMTLLDYSEAKGKQL